MGAGAGRGGGLPSTRARTMEAGESSILSTRPRPAHSAAAPLFCRRIARAQVVPRPGLRRGRALRGGRHGGAFRVVLYSLLQRRGLVADRPSCASIVMGTRTSPRLHPSVLGCRHAGRVSDGRAYRPCTRRLYVPGAPSHGGGGECPRAPIARSLSLTAAPPLSQPAWTLLGVFSPRASCITQVFPGVRVGSRRILSTGGTATNLRAQGPPVPGRVAAHRHTTRGPPRLTRTKPAPEYQDGGGLYAREPLPFAPLTVISVCAPHCHCRLRHSLFVAMLPCTPLPQYTNTSALPFPVCS